MPPEWYPLGGAELIRDLKKRRDALPAGAEAFYEELGQYVNVKGTNRDDVARLTRAGGRQRDLELSLAGDAGAPGPDLLEAPLPGRGDEGDSALPLRRDRPLRRRPGRVAASPCACPGEPARTAGRLAERRHALLRRRRADGSGQGPRHRGLGSEVDSGLPGPGHARGSTSRTTGRLRPSSRSSGGSRIRASCFRWARPTTATASARSPTRRCSTPRSSGRPSDSAGAAFYTGDFRWTKPGFGTLIELSADGAKNYNYYGVGNETTGDRERVHRGRPADLRGLPLARRLREPSSDLLVRPRPRRQVRAKQGRGRHPDRDDEALRLRRLRRGGGAVGLRAGHAGADVARQCPRAPLRGRVRCAATRA